ncbi:MAG: transglutaminase-like domain-containing protein [Phycisphaerales bacterium]
MAAITTPSTDTPRPRLFQSGRAAARGCFARSVAALAVLIVLCCQAPTRGDVVDAGAGADIEHERWFVVQMLGEKAGWAMSRRFVDADGHIVSVDRFEFSLGRMGQDIEIAVESRFVETRDHKPVRIVSIMGLGAEPTETTYEFSDDGKTVTETTRRGDGRPRTRTTNAPAGTWLTPAQISEFVRKRLEADAESIAYATIEASSSLQVVLVRAKVLERTVVEALGKRVPAIKWESTTSVMPDIKMISYVDEQGEDIRSTVNLGGISMEFIVTEKELALAPFDAPEMMAATMVTPVGDVPDPRSSRSASYLLRLTGDDAEARMPDMLDAGGQRVQRLDARTVRVTIDLDRPVAMDEPTMRAARSPETIGSSSMIDLEDAALRDALNQALDGIGDDATPHAKAEAIRRFVYQFIDRKSLGVGFATASETCRTREGDCSEHATLLAALLRLAGIPARTVSGLVYVDQFMDTERVFGFHMWTQALLPIEPGADGSPRWAWIDLDAALSTEHPTDAARIAVVASTLADGDTINSMVDIAVLMGQLGIEVEEPNAPRNERPRGAEGAR